MTPFENNWGVTAGKTGPRFQDVHRHVRHCDLLRQRIPAYRAGDGGSGRRSPARAVVHGARFGLSSRPHGLDGAGAGEYYRISPKPDGRRRAVVSGRRFQRGRSRYLRAVGARHFRHRRARGRQAQRRRMGERPRSISRGLPTCASRPRCTISAIGRPSPAHRRRRSRSKSSSSRKAFLVAASDSPSSIPAFAGRPEALYLLQRPGDGHAGFERARARFDRHRRGRSLRDTAARTVTGPLDDVSSEICKTLPTSAPAAAARSLARRKALATASLRASSFSVSSLETSNASP